MNTLPIDTNNIDFTYLACVPKVDQNGVQARNRDNVPKYEVQLLAASERERRPEVMAVVLTTNTPPDNLAPMSPVQVEGLVARAWSQGDRSGISFSADVIRPSGKPHKPPMPSTNGNKAPEPAPA